MAGNTLTTAASLSCPHGGTVIITPSAPRAMVDGVPVATAADACTVVGCPFTLPTVPPIPSPCVSVQWQVTDLQVMSGAATLSASSQGLCLNAEQAPQGPVLISDSGQIKVSSQ
jgi:hypothetical protein